MGGGGGYVPFSPIIVRLSAAVGVPLPPLPVHHTATLAAVRPVDRLTRVQIQSRALQIWLISELLFLMNVWRMEHALFGGTVACLARSHSFSLFPPGYALLERLFERASPAHAPLEHPVRARDPRLRTARTPVQARCALVRSPAPPPAPRSISKYSLRPEPRSRVTGLTCTRTGVCPGSPGVFLPVPVYVLERDRRLPHPRLSFLFVSRW